MGARGFLARQVAEGPPEGRWHVILDLTKGCNLSCPFCFNSPRAKREVASLDLLPVLAAHALPYAHDLAIGCRHEPLLHPELGAWLAGLRSARDTIAHRPLVVLLTSGTLLDEARARDLLDGGLDILLLSIDSTDDDTYAVLRAPARWSDLRTKLEAFAPRARAAGLPLVAQGLILKASLPHLARTFRDLAALGMTDVQFVQMNPDWASMEPAWWDEGRNQPLVDEIARVHAEARRLGVGVRTPAPAPVVPAGDVVPLLDEGSLWDEHRLAITRPAVCAAPWLKVRIDHAGHVFPCPQMRAARHAWGNIHDAPLPEIAQAPVARALRQALLDGRADHPVCRRCTFGPRA